MTYVAAELEPVMAHLDQTGKLHATREAAIKANFKDDLRQAVFEYCEQNQELPPVGALAFLKDMARKHPDFLRILVGDRDFT